MTQRHVKYTGICLYEHVWRCLKLSLKNTSFCLQMIQLSTWISAFCRHNGLMVSFEVERNVGNLVQCLATDIRKFVK